MEKIAIRFIKSSPPYNAGEIAGFASEVSAMHVKNGFAEWINKADKRLINTQSEEAEPEMEDPENKVLAELLLGSKQQIQDAILAVDENGDHVIGDTILGDMLFYERQARNRKSVLKIIEDVSFERIKAR